MAGDRYNILCRLAVDINHTPLIVAVLRRTEDADASVRRAACATFRIICAQYDRVTIKALRKCLWLERINAIVDPAALKALLADKGAQLVIGVVKMYLNNGTPLSFSWEGLSVADQRIDNTSAGVLAILARHPGSRPGKAIHTTNHSYVMLCGTGDHLN